MSPDGRPATGPTALVPVDALQRFTSAVFLAAGLSAEHAQIVADVLIWASLRGIDSHGVSRIPMYLRLIDAGDLNTQPALTTRVETAASVLVEADRAAGPVAMTMAMRAAVDKARQAGVGLALVRATTHTAALGYYTLGAAQDGMAAMALSASGPMMAYHGARAAGVSTSPISIAVPGGERGPLVLDMATGVVTMGRLLQARAAGGTIPAGWALDARGNPTTEAATAQIPLPLGGPKGSGLALMFEGLTSLVVSNAILAETLEATPAGRRHTQNALTLAIDVARFGDLAAFRSQADRLITALKSLPPDPEIGEILMPGERGRRTLEQRRRRGIPLPPALLTQLGGVANRFGLPRIAAAGG